MDIPDLINKFDSILIVILGIPTQLVEAQPKLGFINQVQTKPKS